jgi:HSP20 family protein
VARIYIDPRLPELGSDLRRFLDWLDGPPPAGSIEYRPPMDVIETPEAVEVVADLPGVSADDIRILFANGTLIITGRKAAPSCEHREAAFHLAERTFGRFACAFRLTAAVDVGGAKARLRQGELHIRLPRIEERRGQEIPIAIEPA